MAMINDKDIKLPVAGIPSNAVAIVESVANEECALASLLEAQADMLCSVIKPCMPVCDFVNIIQSIIRTIKTIVLKNSILESKLRETLNFIKKEGIDCLDLNEQYVLLNNLNSVLESVATEEYSIGNLISALGEGVASISYCDFKDVKEVNILVITLMKVIVEYNMILLRKLRTVISLIEYIKCSEFDIFINIKKKLLCTLKELIKSIFNEEKGLGKLIYGESVKFNEAFKICLNDEELDELENLVGNLIQTICDKRRILEEKFIDTINLLNNVGFNSCDVEEAMDFIYKIQSTAFAGDFELAQIINDETKRVNKQISLEHGSDSQSIVFNSCITCTFVFLLVNLNIGRKNKKTYEFDTCSCNINCNKKGICKKYRNLVEVLESSKVKNI